MENMRFWLYTRKRRQNIKNVVRSRLLSVYGVPSAVIITNNDICFNINFLSLEIGTTDIAVNQFPYLGIRTKNFE